MCDGNGYIYCEKIYYTIGKCFWTKEERYII